MFEINVLRYLFNNKVNYLDDIPSTYFTGGNHEEVFLALCDYIDEFNELPTTESFQHYVPEMDIRLLMKKMKQEIEDEAYIQVHLQKLARNFRYKEAVANAIKDFNDSDLIDNHVSKIATAAIITEEDDAKDLSDVDPTLAIGSDIVKTPLKEWNSIMEDGGFFAPQVIIVMGGPKKELH